MTTSTTTKSRGKASAEELEELHGLLVADLRRCMTAKGTRHRHPSAELLGIVRKTLRDNGVGASDEATRKALQALYRLYLTRLMETLTDPDGGRVPAALLAEARSLLSWHGVGDIPAASAAKVAQQLLQANVPFKTH
jgi:hypothetical protein